MTLRTLCRAGFGIVTTLTAVWLEGCEPPQQPAEPAVEEPPMEAEPSYAPPSDAPSVRFGKPRRRR